MTNVLLDRPYSSDSEMDRTRRPGNELGDRLRRERKRRKETQAETAARFDVNQSSYHRWEDGTNRPDPIHYEPIGTFLGVSLSEVHRMIYQGDEPASLEELRAEIDRREAQLRLEVEELRRDIEDLRDQRRGDRRQNDVQPDVDRRKHGRR
jgi:transcriptional regulator with XRE-family HTH domain